MGTTFFEDWTFTFVNLSWCKLMCFLNRVLEALTRKFVLDKYVSLLTIAKRCPPNLTGADLYALCADAWTNGAKQKVKVSWQFSRHHICPANIWFVQLLQSNSSLNKCGMCSIYTQFITFLVRQFIKLSFRLPCNWGLTLDGYRLQTKMKLWKGARK